VAQHFFSVNLANFYLHLLLLLNPLNCLQSQSNFFTLISLYITSIVLLNLLPNLDVLFLSLSFKLTSKLSTHLYQLLMNSISPVTATFMLMILLNVIQFLSLLDHASLTQRVSFPTHWHSRTLDLVITSANCSSILVYLSMVFLPRLTFLLLLLHLTFHPSLLLPLMRFLKSSLSLLTLILIWILFLHLS